MSIIGSELLLGAEVGGYTVERSLRSTTSCSMTRTPSSAGNRKIFTISCWVKRPSPNLLTILEAGSGGSITGLYVSGTGVPYFVSSGQFTYLQPAGDVLAAADYSAWTHIVVAVDSTQAVSTNRVKFYINGVLENSTSNLTQNVDTSINNTVAHALWNNSTYQILSDFYLIDGQQLTASSFGDFDLNGRWAPIAYTGSYGTNGVHLNFSDYTSTTALGYDSSGGNRHYTPTGFSVTSGITNDSLVDSPSVGTQTDTGAGGEVSANYCTLDANYVYSDSQVINAGFQAKVNVASLRSFKATVAIFSGKYYWEATMVNNSQYSAVGIMQTWTRVNTGGAIWNDLGQVSYFQSGTKSIDAVTSAYGSTFGSAGDVIGVAFDADNGSITFYKNGVSQGVAATGLSGVFIPVFTHGGTSSGRAVDVNFGQKPFAYPVSGYKCLCSSSVSTPVSDPTTCFDTVLYTGNGSTNTISSLNFSPDWVWTKNRFVNGSHPSYNILRGAGKYVYWNNTDAEATDASSLTSFNSNGFTLSSSSVSNTSGSSYIAWALDAGSSSSTNTNGTITSTVRANPSAGFSLVQYTGTSSNGTVGHGLGKPPSLIIATCTTPGYVCDKIVYGYHPQFMGKDKYVYINKNNAIATSSNIWGTSAPDSQVFGVKYNLPNNFPGANFLAYCFTSGYGTFESGIYYKNEASLFPTINTGFAPQTVIIKNLDAVGVWVIFDRKRDGYNRQSSRTLTWNNANTEPSVTASLTFLANGFRVWSGTGSTDTGATFHAYLWMAFAYSPWDQSLGQGYFV